MRRAVHHPEQSFVVTRREESGPGGSWERTHTDGQRRKWVGIKSLLWVDLRTLALIPTHSGWPKSSDHPLSNAVHWVSHIWIGSGAREARGQYRCHQRKHHMMIKYLRSSLLFFNSCTHGWGWWRASGAVERTDRRNDRIALSFTYYFPAINYKCLLKTLTQTYT